MLREIVQMDGAPSASHVPERMLLLSILRQAIDDAGGEGPIGREARSWVLNGDPQFKTYCQLLGIAHEYVQNHLRARLKIVA